MGLHRPGFRVKSGGFIRNGTIPIANWDREKNELVFGVVGPGGAFQYDFEFTFFILFGEVAELSGEPVMPMLGAAIDEVERILRATEIEALRIGLIK